MERVPIMFASDAITSPTGLSRITRELAVKTHTELSDVFEVATCGWGGSYSRRFGFPNYPVNLQGYAIPELGSVWQDFVGDREGILFLIGNASWMRWVADPASLPNCDLKSFLEAGVVKRWLYFPVDSEGPTGKLSKMEADILVRFDRVLTYTEWAAKIVDKTMVGIRGWKGPCQHLPHGTDEKVFYPRSRKEARECFIQKVKKTPIKQPVGDKTILLAINATNTSRKNWALGFKVCGELIKRGVNVGVWAHCDKFQNPNAWDLPMLSTEFGLEGRVVFTNNFLTDEEISWGYAACDCVLGIGSGEGWGLTNSESLACGIPCITGDYAGAAEFTHPRFKIQPVEFHSDGFFANERPVFKVSDWADKVMEVVKRKNKARRSLLASKYFWSNCWNGWSKWLKAGLE